MKNEVIFKAIGNVDDQYIKEAAPAAPKQKKNQKHTWVKWGAIAACLALIVYAGIRLIPMGEISEPNDLPMLTITSDMGGMGFEGLLAYDISELDNGNPWTADTQLDTLPVFRNTVQADSAGTPLSGLSGDEMLAKAKNIAAQMDLTVDKAYTNPTEEDISGEEEKTGEQASTIPTSAVAECGDIEIEVDYDGMVTVWLNNRVSLPEQFTFKHSSTDEQARDALDYLIDEYSSVVDMQSPALDLFADYDFDANRGVIYKVYENSGNLTERILGYNFNTAIFSPDDSGKLWIIRRHTYDLSQKLGDYPIVTVNEAKELLLQGHYITSVPEKLPGEDYVAMVELVYRTSRHDQIYMPYYRFLIELPDMQQENGLKTYGAYYVPAVQQQYISNMPLWDGSFN